jgi:hypothetical protein
MSQFFQGSTSGSLPPTVPTSFVTDSGTAVPAANVLNVLSNDSSTNNANGIQTTGSGNTVTVLLTNRVQGSGSTVGAVTLDVISFPLGATPGTFTFDCRIAGFDAATPSAVGFTIVGSTRTTGASATLLNGQAVDSFDEAATTTASGALVVSGNNAVFRVTGVAGLTIDWNAVMTYTQVN